VLLFRDRLVTGTMVEVEKRREQAPHSFLSPCPSDDVRSLVVLQTVLRFDRFVLQSSSNRTVDLR